MAKFIMSVGDETLRVLTTEAEKRNVRVQQLIRAVIVPEWVRDNLAMSGIESDRRKSPPTRRTPQYTTCGENQCFGRAWIASDADERTP